ncbi:MULTISPECIES: hypothetical protein [unclassified Xanthobacter]|uniref:hypothetical protein n=1 Tax=unclassified Xanthobacter TaxID=2623496 RepID=UPI001EE0357C|nr:MULTISPECIES: hypothetical protein [unclassified Xanthobacter]
MIQRPRRGARGPLALLIASALVLLAGPAAAQPQTDPDWPCAQRKRPDISLATVWTGPDIAAAGPWAADQDAATLAYKLASRRTPMEEVDGLLDGFVAVAGPDAKTRLVRVFAGVYEITSSERAQLMHGIERYARGQERLAARLREEGDALSRIKGALDTPDTPESLALEEKLKWDTRIFDERARSLTYVCETPVILEQRVFEIGRRITDRL